MPLSESSISLVTTAKSTLAPRTAEWERNGPGERKESGDEVNVEKVARGESKEVEAGESRSDQSFVFLVDLFVFLSPFFSGGTGNHDKKSRWWRQLEIPGSIFQHEAPL